MSISLRRGQLEVVQLHRLTGVDAQGKPIYADALAVSARVHRGALMGGATGQGFLRRPPLGDKAEAGATLWIDAAQSLPNVDDKIILPDESEGVVTERAEVKQVHSGALDHVRVKIVGVL